MLPLHTDLAPAFHCPSYCEPSAKMHLPSPCCRSFSHCPMYLAMSAPRCSAPRARQVGHGRAWEGTAPCQGELRAAKKWAASMGHKPVAIQLDCSVLASTAMRHWQCAADRQRVVEQQAQQGSALPVSSLCSHLEQHPITMPLQVVPAARVLIAAIGCRAVDPMQQACRRQQSRPKSVHCVERELY